MAGMLLVHIKPSSPPGTFAGAAWIAPPAGDTPLNVDAGVLLLSSRPSCRFVSPVVTAVEPIFTEPLGESTAMQPATIVTPSAASIEGLSTGQRVNGAQSPFSVSADAEPAPASIVIMFTATISPARANQLFSLIRSLLSTLSQAPSLSHPRVVGATFPGRPRQWPALASYATRHRTIYVLVSV